MSNNSGQSEPNYKRRLLAILAADAVGYTSLMAVDESACVAQLERSRATFRDCINEHAGQVIDMAGDSVLAVFETALGAASTAVAVQQRLARDELALGQGPLMRFRVGVHLGDVLQKIDGSVYGDGINTAARLQSLAPAGAIWISAALKEALRDFNDTLIDRGKHQFKNLERPVHVFEIAAVITDVPAMRTTRVGGSTPKPCVAILPLACLTDANGQEHFADGISEDLITALSKNRMLSVVARNSTFAYKGQATDVRKIAAELSADSSVGSYQDLKIGN